MKEVDLYLPVKRFLERQGYEVKGEIGECDVLATRGAEEPVVVELKVSLSLEVLLQAVDRLAVSSKVYVGVSSDSLARRGRRREVCKLFRMLGLGLLAVCPGVAEPVDVVLDPGEYRPRRQKRRRERLLREFEDRVGDPNSGGATKRGGLMTAYRQRALRIASFLQDRGPTKASAAAAALAEPKAREILYRNVYGWFDQLGAGMYALSPRGRSESPRWHRGTCPAVDVEIPGSPGATADRSRTTRRTDTDRGAPAAEP